MFIYQNVKINTCILTLFFFFSRAYTHWKLHDTLDTFQKKASNDAVFLVFEVCHVEFSVHDTLAHLKLFSLARTKKKDRKIPVLNPCRLIKGKVVFVNGLALPLVDGLSVGRGGLCFVVAGGD